MIRAFFVLLFNLRNIMCQMNMLQPFIVGGSYSQIEDFPHSVYLQAFCGYRKTGACGASIINQWILITAAHCMPRDNCTQLKYMSASFGSANRFTGIKVLATKYIAHEEYDPLNNHECDIALVKLDTPITFSHNIGKVMISKLHAEPGQIATVAGWGVVDDYNARTVLLKNISQKIWSRDECVDILGILPKGVLCAGALLDDKYAANGDSGSALVIHDYVQIGLVSFKFNNTKSLVVYTDIPYHYDWIQANVLKLLCSNK